MIDEWLRHIELEAAWSFARSGGPGGQNVNKVSSKALLRWNVLRSTVLPAEVKDRLLQRLGRRLTSEGDLLISSQRYRDQPRNMEDCRAKLAQWLHEAAHPPVPRRATRPTRASKQRKEASKRRRAERKSSRRSVREE